MAEWTWAKSKEFITKLQEAPKPPVVVPVVPYPEAEGIHKGSQYYTTAISQTIIHSFLENYLSFLEQCKDVILTGRENSQIQNLALSITEGKESTYEKAEAIHKWVNENVDYKRTPYIVPPWELIKPEVSGDCKGFAALVGSLLGAVDIPCWLKLVRIGGTVDLHVYDLASLTWGVVDAVGSWFDREIKPVSGYIVYEIDRTTTWPPKPLPSGAGVQIPEKVKKILPWLVLSGGGLAALYLFILALKER